MTLLWWEQAVGQTVRIRLTFKNRTSQSESASTLTVIAVPAAQANVSAKDLSFIKYFI